MCKHLSEFEIAILVAGAGSRALRQALSEHLLECEQCRLLLAASVEAERAAPRCTAVDGGAGLETVERDRDRPFIQQILERMADQRSATVMPSPVVHCIHLSRVHWDEGERRAALAAKPAVDGDTELPTLTSADGQILVHFRQTGQGDSYRAYVVRTGQSKGGGLRLSFPELSRSFPIDERGEVDLPGIDREALAGSSIQIELSPLPPASEREPSQQRMAAEKGKPRPEGLAGGD
ncbi:MAG: hypothetical protein KAY24_15525 [Candidatus Eisenbacteria sp.]|nr:hypothetical protein [Candidatus Eisenbacteria bacterium]